MAREPNTTRHCCSVVLRRPRGRSEFHDAGVAWVRLSRRTGLERSDEWLAVRVSRRSFFLNEPATTEIYTLSLHDALPIFTQRRPKEAETPLNKLLERQPKNLEAIGLLAAAAALQLKDDETTKLLKQVESLDPDNASA